MTSRFSDELAESMSALRRYQQLMAQAEGVLATATVTVTTADRGISVVVDGRGELTELRFHSPGYRFMRATKLSSLLMKLCNQARQEMAQRNAEAVRPVLSFGAALHDTMTVRDPAGSAGLPDAAS